MKNLIRVQSVQQDVLPLLEAAKYLGCSKWTVYKLVKLGKINPTTYTDGAKAPMYFRIIELKRFLEERQIKRRPRKK